MLIDTFLFCHELDLLELRLRLLYNYVDKFVLFEATTTHSGKEKPLHYMENKARFAWAKDKLEHVYITDHIKVELHGNEFGMENQQRKMLHEAVIKTCLPEDIILHSDIDEIPSREALEDLGTLPAVFEQDFYYYNINCPRKRHWLGTCAVRADYNISDIRTLRGKRREMRTIKNGGWHLSFFMTPEDMKTKLESYCHFGQWGKPPYTDRNYILDHVKQNKIFLKKEEKGETLQGNLPDYFMQELKKYPVFMGEY